MGGSLARAHAEGRSTGIIDLTQGEAATKGTPEERAEEAAAAAKVLGLDVRRNLGVARLANFRQRKTGGCNSPASCANSDRASSSGHTTATAIPTTLRRLTSSPPPYTSRGSPTARSRVSRTNLNTYFSIWGTAPSRRRWLWIRATISTCGRRRCAVIKVSLPARPLRKRSRRTCTAADADAPPTGGRLSAQPTGNRYGRRARSPLHLFSVLAGVLEPPETL